MRIDTLEPVKGRTIVVADLHGCYEQALLLLDRVGLTHEDRVIFAGDFVDRGPNPRECVELAMGHLAVLGNHEEKHLQNQRTSDDRMKPTHKFTRDRLSRKHYEWFEKLPLAIVLSEYNAIVVHAGLYPDVPLAQQQERHLLHIQCINPPNPKTFWPSKAPDDFKFWTNYWKGPERVIFGHSVFDKPLFTEFAVGIDTGACFGGGLTAVILPEWKLVTVPGADYSNGRKTIATFPVHGDVKAFS